ncbi:MAG: hypothetical protein BZY88_11135 [SAR202 cluster bacterium Io17-Chloro-G9]|nr:MAG: hypothetical protein BZY88_11135 [SAR202 cluster bacterium Io17-Chloro-G9]
MLIKFKVCPRCRGDLFLGEDVFGKYLSCLQCGYLKDVEEPKLESNDLPYADAESELEAA